MGKHKKNKPKKEKREIVYRTKEERQKEIREILKQLSKLTPMAKWIPNSFQCWQNAWKGAEQIYAKETDLMTSE